MEYKIIDNIHEGAIYKISRGSLGLNEIPIIIKQIISELPKSEDRFRLKNEFTILNRVNLKNSIKAFHLIEERILLLEDIDGISLKDYLNKNIISISDFFPIAISIANSIDEVHKNKIIHKDIKPSNIIIHPETKEIKLTDFGISTLLDKEYIPSKDKLEGTLEFISPEQTGRTGIAIDHRTDLYSLGITFYYILSGKFPFDSTDPNKILHFHLAQNPKLLHEINQDIPIYLSLIISKLLSKTPEERYLSAEGLKLDLEECYNYFKEEKSESEITTLFTPGKNDFSDKFSIPQKLYGREKEITLLIEEFNKIFLDIKTNLQLVGGYSGIGKTALIRELQVPIINKNGIFISGKYEQYQKNIPFFAIVRAFQKIIKLLLSREQKELNSWKEKILTALGNIGKVIIEVIPELEIIIGKQPDVPEVSPEQSVNRFNYAFTQFIQVFTKKEHPLVLFLDDLQWADQASLSL
ncbi:MAG: AAA family ATPase, partial [Leptospiraceae bacterium]|nr:AAA family ATPase [Leptospiraceae bacterium]